MWTYTHPHTCGGIVSENFHTLSQAYWIIMNFWWGFTFGITLIQKNFTKNKDQPNFNILKRSRKMRALHPHAGRKFSN